MDWGIVHHKDVELVILLENTILTILESSVEVIGQVRIVLDIQRLWELRHETHEVRTIHTFFKDLIADESFVTDCST